MDISHDGTFTAFEKTLKLSDIVNKFYKNKTKDIGIEPSAFEINDVAIKGKVSLRMDTMEVSFEGKIKHKQLGETPIKVIVNKKEDSPVQLYSVIEFKKVSPKKVLEQLMNQKTLNIPFFAHLLMSSELFNAKKEIFGLAFSYTEIYYYKKKTIASEILTNVLQSHIPVGVTLLFPLKVPGNKRNPLSKPVNVAFVINNPIFDLLISQNDKISVTEILPVLSQEFSAKSKDLPEFVNDLKDAYSTHVSFDSTNHFFSVFIRLKEFVDLVPDLLRIQVSNLVLQKKILPRSKNRKWKVSAKGTYYIGMANFDVQYSEIEENNKIVYGLTGRSERVSLDDVINEFDPDFYPDNEAKEMIENTELDNLKMHDVKLYSRIQKEDGTPHILLTGLSDLPQWERNIQIAILIYRVDNSWKCKWAISLKHSPLSNIIEALTGFRSNELQILHNNHIMTTLISSPLAPFTKLPPHIITTPLLRLPVEKGLTIIALIRFPDNCGDDKLCESATKLIDTNTVFTAKGKLSTREFQLKFLIPDEIEFSDQLSGVNNTIQFSIGNTSRMDVITSIKIPHSELIFDGPVHIYNTGMIKLQLHSRKKRWLSPFFLRTISFEDLSFVADYENGKSLQHLDLHGIVKLGIQGNGAEIEAPVRILYKPGSPALSTFYSNLTDISLKKLLDAFTMNIQLPLILEESTFPNGLMLTYSGKYALTSDYSLHGDLNIFGRLLYCAVSVKNPGHLKIITENSPAPVIYARGLIIVQQSEKKKLRGPKIIAEISNKGAEVMMKGYVKLLGIESDVNIALQDSGVEFTVTGKIMEYKETKMLVRSTTSTDSFQVIFSRFFL